MERHCLQMFAYLQKNKMHTFEIKKRLAGPDFTSCYLQEKITSARYNEDETAVKNSFHRPVCRHTGVIEIDDPSRPQTVS